MNPRFVPSSAARPMRLVLTFVFGLFLALACFSAFGRDAQAISDTERYRFSSNFCISERAQTYEWWRDDRLYGQSVTRPLRGDCSTPFSAPPGYIWGEVWVEKWDPYYDRYFYCDGDDWYNSSWTSRHVVYDVLGRQYQRTCGSGWYRTWARGSVWISGAWRNTPWVNSGEAYFY